MEAVEDDRSTMPIDSRLGHVIKRTEQALIAANSAVLRGSALTVPQYSALLVLADTPGISGAQLARRCLVTPQAMSAVLTNLLAKGFVSREPSSVHSRVIVTHLTPSGDAVLRAADSAALALERHLVDALSVPEQLHLRALLERAVSALRDGAHGPPAR